MANRLKKGVSGFSLAEVMLAVILAAFLFATLAAFYAGGFNYQTQQISRVTINNRALRALKAIQQQVEQASVLGGPIDGNAYGTLFGGINVRPDNAQALDPSQVMSYFFFCVANTSLADVCAPAVTPCPALWLYTGNWPPPNPGPWPPVGGWNQAVNSGIACGAAASGANGYRDILAGPLDAGTVTPFTRPIQAGTPVNDIIHADFLVHLNAQVFNPTQQAQGLLDVSAPVQLDVRARLAANP